MDDKDFGIAAIIPREIILRRDISQSSKLLYAILSGLCRGPRKECFAGNKFLSEIIGVKKRRLYQLIEELEEKKLITVKERDGNRIMNITWKSGK